MCSKFVIEKYSEGVAVGRDGWFSSNRIAWLSNSNDKTRKIAMALICFNEKLLSIDYHWTFYYDYLFET